MRYWFDTEFDEDGRRIALISIGLVAEDGRELYLENAEYDLAAAPQWLQENVIPHLQPEARRNRTQIRQLIAEFIGHDQPEFWAYFGEYDWIALRQLFGNMMQWPKGWPLTHLDLEQLRVHCGAPALKQQTGVAHHALADARWTREAWRGLTRTHGHLIHAA